MSYKFSPEQWNFHLRHQLKNSRYVGSESFPAVINRDFERITFSNNMTVIERSSPWFNR